MDASLKPESFPVDVVLTWVDGADPVWNEQKQQYRKLSYPEEEAAPREAVHSSRFRDNGELRYSLRSVAAFAPWVRKVHLVTADQKPRWLNTDTVHLVSHRDIFPDAAMLPVFNSLPIECCLHRVPGLAEHFIYLNDDVMFGRQLSKDDFFLPNGDLRLWLVERGKKYMERLLGKLGGPALHSSSVAMAHHLVHERYGKRYPFVVSHYPKAMRCSSAAALWEAFPETIEAMLHSRFRSVADVHVGMLYLLYLLAEGRGTAYRINGLRRIIDVLTGKGAAHMGASIGDANCRRKMRAIALLRPRGFCINDSPKASESDLLAFRAFLEAMFPHPCQYEVSGT